MGNESWQKSERKDFACRRKRKWGLACMFEAQKGYLFWFCVTEWNLIEYPTPAPRSLPVLF